MRSVLRTIRYLLDYRCFAMTWKLGSFRGSFQTLHTGSTRCITGPTTHSEEVEQVEKSLHVPQTLTNLWVLHHHLDLQVEASRSPLLWYRCTGSWRRTPTTRFSTYPSSLAGDPVTMWQCDPVTSPVKFAWAKQLPLSPSLCYLGYIYVLFFLPSIACRHLSSVPEHPWASPIKKLSFFIQRTSGDSA